MKKFIFSAVAMIAFVGSSMGNTITPEDSKVNHILSEPNWLCVSVGFAASDAVLANGGSPQEAAAAAEGAYNRCTDVMETVKALARLIQSY